MDKKIKHIGFIVDGNRRWAKAHNLPTIEGHRKGAKKVELVVEALAEKQIDYITFFIFSTENWKRSPEEVSYLMKLIMETIDNLVIKLEKHNMRCLILGRKAGVDPKIWQKLQSAEDRTQHNTGTTVCICFNYGGQQEIVDATNKAILSGQTDLSISDFEQYLYHPEVPNLDLLVRTSGEQRISGFMLWRAAYAEMLFIDKNFPDINRADCDLILDEFQRRHRRFGK